MPGGHSLSIYARFLGKKRTQCIFYNPWKIILTKKDSQVYCKFSELLGVFHKPRHLRAYYLQLPGIAWIVYGSLETKTQYHEGGVTRLSSSFC